MKTYQAFKQENGVETFKFRQSIKTERWVAEFARPLMVSIKFKGNKDELVKFLATAFVTRVTHNKEGVEYPEPLYVICHQAWGDSAEG